MEMRLSEPPFALAGHSFNLIGDIASARVSYQRSDAGDGRAALRGRRPSIRLFSAELG